jgi:hydrogenase/urease accessory protein HupE
VPSSHRLVFLLCAALLGLTGVCRGHGIEQLRGELSVAGGGWEATVWIPAWMLYAPEGPSAPSGDPGEPGSAGGAWAASLSRFEHAEIRAQGDEFLHSFFWISVGDVPLDFTCEFPDYATSPPVFEEDSDQNALVRVVLSGALAPGLTGPLTLHWDDPDDILILQVKSAGAEAKPAVKVFRLDSTDRSAELLTVGEAGQTTAAAGSTLLTWIIAGYEHILPLGLDHILFILGLFLLQPKIRPLLWQTSAFTVAHSLTLGLVVLGVISVPPRVVEPLIALSIVYVGVENLWVRELKPWRVALVFGLGLLHGMGFAGVMQELELPADRLLEPLVGFNLGVELGQVSVLLLGFAVSGVLLVALRGWHSWRPGRGAAANLEWLRKLASAAIACTGLWWTIERVFL